MPWPRPLRKSREPEIEAPPGDVAKVPIATTILPIVRELEALDNTSLCALARKLYNLCELLDSDDASHRGSGGVTSSPAHASDDRMSFLGRSLYEPPAASTPFSGAAAATPTNPLDVTHHGSPWRAASPPPSAHLLLIM